MTAPLLASRARNEAAQPLSAEAGVKRWKNYNTSCSRKTITPVNLVSIVGCAAIILLEVRESLPQFQGGRLYREVRHPYHRLFP